MFVMQKNLLFIFLLCICLQTYSQFGGGSGTAEDPYQIYTKEHIDSMVNQNTNGKYYVLMNDITDTITDKICYSLFGSFNGKGHSLIVNSECLCLIRLWHLVDWILYLFLESCIVLLLFAM